jgi:hypothetical protein
LLGGFAANQLFGGGTGTNFGATAGGIAGSVFGPLGAGAGSFLGGAVGSLFNQGQGNNAAAATFNLATGELQSLTWGNNNSDPENLQASSSIAQQILGLGNIVGGSNFAGRVQVGAKSGLQLDGVSYNSVDELLAAAFEGVVRGATQLNEQLKEVILGFEGTAEQTALFAQSVISLNDASGINTVTQAIEDYANIQPTMMAAYRDQTAGLRTLIANFDGSAASASELNNALLANKAAAYEMAIAIQAIGDQIAQSAQEQALSIRESVMTQEELRRARVKERNELRGELGSMTDPEKIAAASARILELNRQIFDSLGEFEQQKRAEEFAIFAERTAEQAERRLDVSIQKLQETQEDINAKIQEMLQDTARKQQLAADTQVQAAQLMIQAARELNNQSAEVV